MRTRLAIYGPCSYEHGYGLQRFQKYVAAWKVAVDLRATGSECFRILTGSCVDQLASPPEVAGYLSDAAVERITL
jgi:hypothetical protein